MDTVRSVVERESTGHATLTEVLADFERQLESDQAGRLRPIATGFSPLDDILNGGLRPGELLVVGGPFGVGKTIWGLQVARNAVAGDPGTQALYICYEHDRQHLMSRLLCLETAEQGLKDDALTLRKLEELISRPGGQGLLPRLSAIPRYAPVIRSLWGYSDRLSLAKASGDHTNMDLLRQWMEERLAAGPGRLLVVVDYLQKVPVARSLLEAETEVTTYITQSLKEAAMALGIQIIAIAASDRLGLRSKRMRLADLRGSSALQYEADIGLVLNNKFSIVSREHMIYNRASAESMRDWVVMSVEKNRAGRNAVDMEYQLDAAHFRMDSRGDFVKERLVDEKVTLE